MCIQKMPFLYPLGDKWIFLIGFIHGSILVYFGPFRTPYSKLRFIASSIGESWECYTLMFEYIHKDEN